MKKTEKLLSVQDIAEYFGISELQVQHDARLVGALMITKPQFDLVELILKMNHDIDDTKVCFIVNPRKPGRTIDQLAVTIQEVLDGK